MIRSSAISRPSGELFKSASLIVETELKEVLQRFAGAMSEVIRSIRRLPLRSIRRPKCVRKSAPNIAVLTSATMNCQEKHGEDLYLYGVFSGRLLLKEANFFGTIETTDPESIKRGSWVFLSYRNRRCSLRRGLLLLPSVA
ncbi:hypothetical protein ABEB36_012852 [Hypothenemus hampei]|uniref:Uncharacterized protein n=1 Tax=Hypothenemus hampei TaxID=57062 RepID=A0ABD1E6W7_HYPHA